MQNYTNIARKRGAFATFAIDFAMYGNLFKFHIHSNIRTHTQNTPMHDEQAYDMYKELKECGELAKQYRKSIALVAAMRLKRHRPDESLEILSIHDDIDVNIRYVRILSHAYLNQFNEVFRLLELTIASPYTENVIKIPEQLVN